MGWGSSKLRQATKRGDGESPIILFFNDVCRQALNENLLVHLIIPFSGFIEVCTDLYSKEPHRQLGLGNVVTPGSLSGEIVSTLAQNARDVGSIPALGAIFSHFHQPS